MVLRPLARHLPQLLLNASLNVSLWLAQTPLVIWLLAAATAYVEYMDLRMSASALPVSNAVSNAVPSDVRPVVRIAAIDECPTATLPALRAGMLVEDVDTADDYTTDREAEEADIEALTATPQLVAWGAYLGYDDALTGRKAVDCREVQRLLRMVGYLIEMQDGEPLQGDLAGIVARLAVAVGLDAVEYAMWKQVVAQQEARGTATR